MNWYGGSIAEAVQLSKQRNAVFVVFVEGPNESSKQMAALLDVESIRRELESSKYVAIRIQSETEAYTQFAQIYKLVPLPSVFFLGDNGAPMAIVTEVTKTAAELDTIIQSLHQPATTTADGAATAAPNVPAASSSTSSVAAAAAAPIAAAAAVAAPAAAEVAAGVPADVRLQRAKDLVEQKRKEHEAEQQRLEKERELERRRSGQDLRTFKERQQEIDMKQLKEERQRDKLAEQAIRKRILEQIAQDRAMSAARYANSAEATTASEPKPAPALPRVYTGTEARIQFRKPDGSAAAHEFLAADTLQTIRDYVTVELLAGNGNFTLASSFPRRQFGDDDATRSLVELDLAPTAVILVTSSDKALRGDGGKVAAGAAATSAVRGAADAVGRLNVFGLAQSAFWTLMMPVLSLMGYLRRLIGGGGGAGAANVGTQKRENEERISDNDAAKRRNLSFVQPDAAKPSTSAAGSSQPSTSTGAYKRVSGMSNIHRLHETQDSDDDTNTWNGNSTQQQ